jgi:cold shock CspA family protein
MQVPPELSFHGMPASPAIERLVREQMARLERFGDIISCRVIASAAHRQPHKSSLALTVEVSVPGDTLVARREARSHQAHNNADVYGVVRDAFDAVVRQIEDHAARRRHQVKIHDGAPVYGRVVRLNPQNDHGFIETAAGVTLFFHRVVVENDGFDRLAVGSEVEYSAADEDGAYGPQAKWVRAVGAAAAAG